jgi:copper oxidase (laccase) domain-containing protein
MSHRAPAVDLGELLLELPGRGRALFTSRAAGNLSTGMGEGHEHGIRRREELCERHGLRWVCSSHQVHGTAMHVIDREMAAGGEPVALEADGHATNLAGVGAMVMVALGCESAVAMIHAGWRGLAAGALEQGVRALREISGDEAIEAIVGPCAGICCYEVGPEVHAAFGGARRADGHLDLRAIAHERLRDTGVGRIGDVEACTICDERFFSYRREGPRAGRQAGVAWLS